MVTTDPLRQGSAKACSKCACWAQPTRLPRACPMDSGDSPGDSHGVLLCGSCGKPSAITSNWRWFVGETATIDFDMTCG